jgi:hypothetical protein
MKTRLPVAVLLCAGALAGCSSEMSPFARRMAETATVSESEWISDGTPLPGADLEALWDRTKDVLGAQGYAVDGNLTNYAARTIITRWRVSLSPIRYEGRRTRAWVRFQEPNPGEWTVSAAVQSQQNTDIDSPGELTLAKWEQLENDVPKTNVLLYLIESGFREAGEPRP